MINCEAHISGFFPSPIPISQTTDGLKALKKKTDSEHHKFPSLFIAQTLNFDGCERFQSAVI